MATLIKGEFVANNTELNSTRPFIKRPGLTVFAAYLPGRLYSARRGAAFDYTLNNRDLILKAQNPLLDWAMQASDNFFYETPFTGDQLANHTRDPARQADNDGNAIWIAMLAKLPSDVAAPALSMAKSFDAGVGGGFFGMVYTPNNRRILLQSNNGVSGVVPFVSVPLAALDIWAFYLVAIRNGECVAYCQAPGGALQVGAIGGGTSPRGTGTFRLNDPGGVPVNPPQITGVTFGRGYPSAADVSAIRLQIQQQVTEYGAPIDAVTALT